MLESYCNGIESDVTAVKRKTGEEYHFWLERKVVAAKKLMAEANKAGRMKR
jgi:hypothetical protein